MGRIAVEVVRDVGPSCGEYTARRSRSILTIFAMRAALTRGVLSVCGERSSPVAQDRYYDATKYAHDLDESHDRDQVYHHALCKSLDSKAIPAADFEQIAREAGVDLKKPDATSQYPQPVQWWNVATRTHVLIAQDGEGEKHWAFPVRSDARMKKLAQRVDEKDREERTREE